MTLRCAYKLQPSEVFHDSSCNHLVNGFQTSTEIHQLTTSEAQLSQVKLKVKDKTSLVDEAPSTTLNTLKLERKKPSEDEGYCFPLCFVILCNIVSFLPSLLCFKQK